MATSVPMDITKCGYTSVLHQMWQHLEYPWILITKCGYFCTPPNVATFGYYQMWLLLYSKCGNVWGTHGYYQMWLLLYSTKCGNIWSTHGYYQMWVLMWQHFLDITKYGYYCTPNVATFGVPMDITKCGYFCTPPNVATFGVPLDITKCGYFCTPPNEATFGVPMDITKFD